MASGERERLSFDDAQILRLESDAIKGHTGKVLVVAAGEDGEPLDPKVLRARVAERIGPLKRLRQKLSIPRFGRPSWVDAPEMDLEWHGPGADTSLDRHIGPAREVARSSFPLERLKAIEHAAGDGVTVNDVVLAVVAGGLRSWLEDEGGRPELVRVQVPVSLHLRTEAKDQLGNHDSFLNVDLPLGEPDAGRRLRLINTETSERKLDHDAETLYSFFHAVGCCRPIYRGITRLTSGPREFALSVSNVPGPRRRPSILGRRIVEFVCFAEPADRHALRISVISLGGDLALGLCSDPDAIGGLDRLAAALDESVLELERATGAASGS